MGLGLEGGTGLGQPDLLGGRPDVGAGLLEGHEQAARQLLPQAQPVRVAAGPQRHGQVGGLSHQVEQGTHVGVCLAGTGIKQGVQMPRPAAGEHAPCQRHRQVPQLGTPGGALHAQVAVEFDMVAVE